MWNSHFENAISRRDFLLRAGAGFGALALTALLAEDSAGQTSPMAPKATHFAPRAKSVIWLFMEGGPSHIDLFDPKPLLQKLAGQPMPPSFGKVMTSMGTASNGLMPSKRQWQQHGRSGIWVSDWYPNIAQHVDDIA